MTPLSVTSDRLVDFGARVLESVDVPRNDALLVSDSLVTADLWGHPSHGIMRLPWYYNRIRSGVMKPRTCPEVVRSEGAIAVLDGGDGVGQVLADHALTEAVRRCKRYGIGAVGVRNSNHFGTAAYFTRKAAEAGAIVFLTTNASPAMAPWGGLEKAVGTNPWSWAVPGGRLGPVVMDISNTTVARGKIYVARDRGEQIPVGWAHDKSGAPTTDPAAAIEGLILPMAGHKGYVIAVLMDILAGVLTGSQFGSNVGGPYEFERRSGAGHLAIALDIHAFMPVPEFTNRVSELLSELSANPRRDDADPITYPGEREDRHRLETEAAALVLPEQTWTRLNELAVEVGLPKLGRHQTRRQAVRPRCPPQPEGNTNHE